MSLIADYAQFIRVLSQGLRVLAETILIQLVVFADSDVSLRLETVADQAAISSNTVSPAVC